MDVSLRVITDHIRSATFMICDGVLPSNEGRGYVLRRLLRRAARHGKLLGVNAPFLHEVIATVVQENECQYPELREKQAYITRVVKTEEENFARTIDAGMRIFSELLDSHKSRGESVFSGADAFKLYDTYGFPIDLTIEMCADEGMTVDEQGFRQLMEEQRVRARKAREALGDLGWAGIDFGKEIPETEFVGYDRESVEAKLLAIVADGEFRDEITAGAEAILVLDRTTLYAEMGGQAADHGTIRCGESCFRVSDVQKNKGGKFMHYGRLESGTLRLGDAVTAAYCPKRRAAIRRAHSATHLLQRALRDVLGEHVHQAGSLVEPDFLRFDFTHFSAVTPGQLRIVEDAVNAAILSGLPVEVKEMGIAEARSSGAMALFGEKYGDVVRVVSMGDYSVELCGGTHLDNTALAGAFHISSEGSIASGVRRIEATTGLRTLQRLHDDIDTIDAVAAVFKANPADALAKVEQQSAELKEAKRLIQQYRDKESAGGADAMLRSAKEIGGVHVLTAQVEGDANALRKLGDALRDKDSGVVAVMAAVNGEKITFQCVCGRDAVAKGIRAGDIIKSVTAIAGGKGGGKPDSAMGGGSDLSKLKEALAAVESCVCACTKN